MLRHATVLSAILLAACASTTPPAPPEQDAKVLQLMEAAAVPGLALAIIEGGRVTSMRGYGYADVAKKVPMRPDTILYGASLTKAAFAYMVMQLVDEGKVDLDAPLPALLARPLPDYPDFSDLANDARWRRITPRMLLSHTSGLLNWRWINDDKKLDFKFDPGSRYVYSGEGIQLLQLVVEERTGMPLAELMQQRVFDRFGMKDTSMTWRADFEGRATVHYDATGQVIAHRQRSKARAAGSMDMTLADYAQFMAGVLRGEGLSPQAHATMLSKQLDIVSPRQFPSHWPGTTEANRPRQLAIGLGWPLFESSRGPSFFKEGSDDGTNNLALGFTAQKDGIVVLTNSSNATKMFKPLVDVVYGPTCLPWFWMGYIPYDRPELMDNAARDRTEVSPGCS